jgi:hypothetical protein
MGVGLIAGTGGLALIFELARRSDSQSDVT